MPEALISSIEHMNKNEKIFFIISVSKCEYVSEWTEIYEKIVYFVYFMKHEIRHLAVTIYNNMFQTCVFLIIYK